MSTETTTALRMRDLVERTGVPSSTIHFYLRQGLLPAPTKTARNAATYDDRHVERLRLLQRLRSDEGGSLPLPQVRRVIEWIERGVEPDVAILLQREVAAGFAGTDGPAELELEAVAKQAGLPLRVVRDLVAAGLVVSAPSDGDPVFDELDLHITREYARRTKSGWFTLEDLAPIARMIRELSQYEMALRNRIVRDLSPTDAAKASLTLQQLANLLHRYMFFRSRQHDIAELQKREGQGQVE